MKHKFTYYIYKVKCLIKIHINFTNVFDRGHGHMTMSFEIRHTSTHRSDVQHLQSELVPRRKMDLNITVSSMIKNSKQ